MVAVHVPMHTTDAQLETLIHRFGKVARESRDFGKMKIQPTTPADPRGRYARLTIFVFTHDAWAEPEMLRRYVAARDSDTAEAHALREAFEKAVRGYYRLDGMAEEGRLGALAASEYSRELFRGELRGP